MRFVCSSVSRGIEMGDKMCYFVGKELVCDTSKKLMSFLINIVGSLLYFHLLIINIHNLQYKKNRVT